MQKLLPTLLSLPHDWGERLSRNAAALQINLAPDIVDKLAAYALLLMKWNKAYNLTALDTPELIAIHHFLDSLAIAPHIVGPHVLDVGSGAGFPGLPLALILPACKFTLLDSNSKKVRFLRHVVLALALDNVSVAEERVEKFHFHQCFATIVTRATSSITEIVQKTRSLICAGNGQWLFMKGKYPERELQEFAVWRQKLQVNLELQVQRLIVPELDAERHLVRVKYS